MERRGFLKAALGGAGGIYLMGIEGGLARAAEAGACLRPWNGSTHMMSWPAKKPPYRIALSNSYIGNTWRTEMLKIAKAYTDRPSVKKYLKDFKISSSGNNVSAQIAQINEMILSGTDAIVVDAATPTGLNSVIDQAVGSGILVVSFDNVVTTHKAVTVNQSQYEMGKRWADFLVKHMGDKGRVLMVRGVAGTYVDQMLTKGGMDVFNKHPGISTTQVYGNWDDGTAQKVSANALASSSEGFDGIWCQGGTTGTVRAFLQAGDKVPPVGGEAENGVRKLAAKLKFPMLSIGQSPTLVAVATMAAIKLLQGEKVPREIRTPIPETTTAELKPGVNYYPDLPDDFFTAINIDACDLKFNVKKMLAEKV